MISYKPLFELLKQRDINLYAMEHTYGFSKTTLYRMKHEKDTSMMILNDLCKALNCRVEDIIVYVEDQEKP